MKAEAAAVGVRPDSTPQKSEKPSPGLSPCDKTSTAAEGLQPTARDDILRKASEGMNASLTHSGMDASRPMERSLFALPVSLSQRPGTPRQSAERTCQSERTAPQNPRFGNSHCNSNVWRPMGRPKCAVSATTPGLRDSRVTNEWLLEPGATSHRQIHFETHCGS